MPAQDLTAVFARLKRLLEPYAPSLVVAHDTPDNYYLNAAVPGPNGQPLYFGSVAVKKNYVSFYLMPVYMVPALLDGISDGLRKRMQGKSCFNFTRIDEPLIAELGELTARGFARFRQDWLD